MAPGVDMLAPLQPGILAFVVIQDGAIIHRTCAPAATLRQSITSPGNPRPRAVPGTQTLIERIPQPDTCMNTADEAVPAMQRCWAARGFYNDTAVFSARVPDERTYRPVPDNMVGRGQARGEARVRHGGKHGGEAGEEARGEAMATHRQWNRHVASSAPKTVTLKMPCARCRLSFGLRGFSSGEASFPRVSRRAVYDGRRIRQFWSVQWYGNSTPGKPPGEALEEPCGRFPGATKLKMPFGVLGLKALHSVAASAGKRGDGMAAAPHQRTTVPAAAVSHQSAWAPAP